MQEQMLKGVSFHLLMEFVREVLGPGALQPLLEITPRNTAGFYGSDIAKNMWYPLRYFSDLELAIIKKHFKGDMASVRFIARYTMTRARSDIYRIAFLGFKKPVDTLVDINKMWTLYNRPGKAVLELVDEEKAKAVIRLFDTHDIPDLYLEHLCGWVETMLRSCGASAAHTSWNRDQQGPVFNVLWEQ